MKKPKLQLVVFFVLALISYTGSAQILQSNDASKKINGAELLKTNPERNSIDFVRLSPTTEISEQDHLRWLTQQVLKPAEGVELRLTKTETDLNAYTHYRYKQYYKNIPVEYGVYYVHVKNAKVIAANGEYYTDIKNTASKLSKHDAFERALAVVASSKYKTGSGGLNEMEQQGALVYYPVNNQCKLAYKFDIYSLEPLKRVYLYIDAATGKKLGEVDRIHTSDVPGTATTAYNGTVSMTTDSVGPNSYRLRASKGFGGLRTLNLNNGTNYASATDFTDTDNNWNLAGLDRYAYDAHFGSEATYDWYHIRFGRDSYDNAGAQINAYVHYSSGFVNAFWDGTQMTYGDGDGIDYTPLTSLDIVGHEITHAVTEHTAGLVYSNESGALNEAYSDCFGVTIDFFKNPATANFLEGDQINISGIPFRNMGNPNQFNNPDTYGGLFWNSPNEVHNNSGVMNYWYYLLCMGGSGTNDLGNAFTVNGIGLTDASAIAYRSLSVYLTPNSNYADARFYSIQSAIDLFGNCSPQVVQVTNAWYAVGVGGIFSNAVVAGFASPQNYFCVLPSNVIFNNQSINASTYIWYFGDGDSSTLANPSHTYISAGVYTVTLIANGLATCSSSDTLVLTGYITVTNGGGPVSANCYPTTTSACCGIGITNVHFNTINNTSAVSTEGFKDFTCGTATSLVAGNPVPITITTGISSFENVKAWIDYNNDGLFTGANELVFTSTNKLTAHSGIVNTFVGAVTGTPLRMRVMDDNFSNTIASACSNPQNGQAEDYTITFTANALPPIADFTSNVTTINVGGTVYFTDLTQNAPLNWQWNFAGGVPATSNLQNPSVIYNTVGDYAVTLTASNTFGVDSVTKTTYIHVVNSINMCSGITTTAAPNGQLYDSGGPLAGYLDGENCSLLIDPGCAISITLTFTQFASESCCDYIRVYDGPDATSPLLLTAQGSTIPATVTANSGKMFIVWHTDGSVTYPGFAASWTSVIATGLPPVAAFSVLPSPPVLTPVQFSDQTTNTPLSWIWDFGDSQFSTLQNPTHTYSSPGTYTVQLIATNCITSDTVSQNITIQNFPVISVNPDSISVALNCSDSITVPITVYNTGSGDLVFDVSGNSVASTDTVQVLAFMDGVDTGTEYPNTIAALSQYFTRFKITQISSTLPGDLQTALTGKDVLLFPEQETGISSYYSALTSVVQNFASSGGNVIILGSNTPYSSRLFDMGFFTGSFINYTNSGTINVLDTTDDIANNVALSFPVNSGTFYCDFTNADKTELASYLNYDIVAYRNVGSGKVIYLAFDYYSYDNNMALLLANSISLGSSSLPDWAQVTPSTDTIQPGDSTIIYVTISTAGMNAGTYDDYLSINSNDSANSPLNVPLHLVVSGPAILALSDTCLNFGLITQYTSSTDSVSISNSGCDTLHITSVISSDSAFSAAPAVLNIAPGSSQNILVTFNPQTIGSFNAILTILNNDQDTSICLTGSSGAAPEINVNPDSISVSLNCNDSITIPITISNTGGSNLIYTTQGNGFGLAGDTSVLVIQDGTAWSLNVANFIQTNYGIVPTVITSSQIASTDFMVYDVIVTVSAQSTTYYNLISTNVAKFETFVAAGGILQYQMATMSGSTTVNLVGGAVMNYGTQPQNNGVLLSHPILAGVTNPIIGSSASHSYLSNLPVGTQIITEIPLAQPTTVEYAYGNGFVIASGMTWEFYYGGANTLGLMLPNATSYSFSKISALPSWIYLTQQTDTLAPGDSSIIYVTISSAGLNAGTYIDTIEIVSNDPLTPVVSVPVILQVTGPASIAMSDTCLNFGTITQFTSATDSVTFYNNGCDTLHITSISSSDNAFSAIPSTLNIPPGSSQNVSVIFNPQTIGSFNAILTILNNDHDTTICLTGSSGAAPAISFNPDSITVSVNACSDSITVPFYIINSGGSDLYYQLNGSALATRHILAMTAGVDMATGSEYQLTIGAIQNYFTNYTLATTATTTPSVLQTDLQNMDVLLMPEHELSITINYTALATIIQNFVANGGTVIICGSIGGNSTNRIYDLGLFTGSYVNYTNAGTLNVITPSDSIMNGVPATFNATNSTFYHTITNADKVSLVKYLSVNDVVAYRNIGSGRAVYIGFDYFSTNPVTERIISNAVRYATSSNLPPWVQLSQVTDTVTDGDSSLIYVTFYPGSLAGGAYHSSIIVHSNDPLNPVDTIPVTLNVSLNPCAGFTYNIPSTCNGIVNFTDTSFNSPTSWLWNFGDGQTSVLQNPTHQYLAAGTYNVTLIATNAFGTDTIITSVTVSVLSATYTVTGTQVIGQPLQFTPTTAGSTTHIWDFNDGNISTLTSPSHVYTTAGTYIVCHTISNATCTNTVCDTIVIGTVGINEFGDESSFMLQPNPFQQNIQLSYTLSESKTISLLVTDVSGRIVKSFAKDEIQASGHFVYTFNTVANGAYYVVLTINGNPTVRKVMKIE